MQPKRFKYYLTWILVFFLLIFGLYLWLKNGLILDYGTKEEIQNSHSEKMIGLGFFHVIISLLYLVFLLIKTGLRVCKKEETGKRNPSE